MDILDDCRNILLYVWTSLMFVEKPVITTTEAISISLLIIIILDSGIAYMAV